MEGVQEEDDISFQQLLHNLRIIFADASVNVEEVTSLLKRYKTNPSDWTVYAKFDKHKYTRNLVEEGNGKYNVMILAWGEEMKSSIHDHPDSHCFVKVLQGQLKESLFQWPKHQHHHPLIHHSATLLQENDIAYINDSIGIHRMENPSETEKAVSLHLYVPPFSKCLTFDPEKGTSNRCKVTFWSKFGERTPPLKTIQASQSESLESLN